MWILLNLKILLYIKKKLQEQKYRKCLLYLLECDKRKPMQNLSLVYFLIFMRVCGVECPVDFVNHARLQAISSI